MSYLPPKVNPAPGAGGQVSHSLRNSLLVDSVLVISTSPWQIPLSI